MPDKSDLLGKIVMIISSDVRLGKLQSLEPLVLSAPYLIITGGCAKNPTLEFSCSGSAEVLGNLEIYRPDSLAQKLEKNFCFTPAEAENVVRMAQGLYQD